MTERRLKIGLFGAGVTGKSTTIHRFAQPAEPVEKEQDYVATPKAEKTVVTYSVSWVDQPERTPETVEVSFYDSSGQFSYKKGLPNLSDTTVMELNVIVVMYDRSVNVKAISKSMVKKIKPVNVKHGVPVVVLGNKSDLVEGFYKVPEPLSHPWKEEEWETSALKGTAKKRKDQLELGLHSVLVELIKKGLKEEGNIQVKLTSSQPESKKLFDEIDSDVFESFLVEQETESMSGQHLSGTIRAGEPLEEPIAKKARKN